MDTTTIYRLVQAAAGNRASLVQVFAGPNAALINAACAIQVGSEQLLATYNEEAGEVSLFTINDVAPTLKSKINVGGEWNLLESVRNDSLNDSVFLRCVAKRWRQEDEAGGYFPIQPNTFIFRNFSVAIWDRRT